jgi:hypothetical protein
MPVVSFTALMRTNASKLIEKAAPEITEDKARELFREGERAAREYRQHVEEMWSISKDERQARTR